MNKACCVDHNQKQGANNFFGIGKIAGAHINVWLKVIAHRDIMNSKSSETCSLLVFVLVKECAWLLNISNTTSTICWSLEVIFPHVLTSLLDTSHKSQNALHKYPTMHQFVAEMSTPVHFSVIKWGIVGYRPNAKWGVCSKSANIYLAHDIDLHMNKVSLICTYFTVHFILMFFLHEILWYNNHTPSTSTKFSPRMDK